MNAAIAFFGSAFYAGIFGMAFIGISDDKIIWVAGMGVGLITSAILASKKCDKAE